MRCPKCDQENRHDAKFCSECGAQLEQLCPSCSATLSLGAKFCDACGTRLTLDGVNDRAGSAQVGEESAGPISPEAERRQLTVMFVDLVDSTKLSAELDPEDMREVIRSYHAFCAEQISRFEGRVAQYLGDGVLAYFGWPKAHEGDAEQAVRAGLAITQDVGRVKVPTGEALEARVGIKTGLVVVGDLTGKGAVVGETPNVAARLQSLAEPGTVIIGPTTQRLVDGLFLCEELGPRRFKGISDPVMAYRVRSETEAASRFEAKAIHGLTPLIGRREEIALLLKRWTQARDGESQVILLSGEAGVGKSRIVRSLREQLQDEPHIPVLYYGSPYYQNSAFYPVIRQLERSLGFVKADSPAQKLGKLEERVKDLGLSARDTVPVLASLLSLSGGNRYPALELAPEQLKKKTFETLVAMLRALALSNPVLMVVEDMHWIDPSTKELVTLLVEQLQSARFLLIMTFRLEFVPPWSADLHVTQLMLKRLTRKENAALITHVTRGKFLPDQVMEQIILRTDGVALFIEELTKAVLESGLLQDTGDRFVLSGPLPPLAIPASLQDSLMARLDRLATVKEVAQLGATLGRTFSHEMLAAVSPLKDRELEGALAQLVEAELLHRRGSPPAVTYVFKHALVQDAAYQSLLKSTRQQYHERIARALEDQEQFAETAETEPELLAHHYTEAGLASRAIDYWQKAGQKAVERSAHVEAIQHLTIGLDLLKTLPETFERNQLEINLQICLGASLTATKGYGAKEVESTYTRARELSRQVGDTSQNFRSMYGLWRLHMLRAEYTTARVEGEEILRLATDAGNPSFVVAANRAIGATLFYMGKFSGSKEHVEQVIASTSQKSDGKNTLIQDIYDVVDPRVTCRSYAAWDLWLLGYPEQASRESEKALALAGEIDHPFSKALALSFATWLSQFFRDGARTSRLAQESLDLSNKQGFPFWIGWGRVLRGWALADLGQGEEAIREILEGIAFWRAKGSELGRAYFLALLAETYGKEGKPRDALNALAEAQAFADKTEEHFWEAERCRLRGELILQNNGASEHEAEKCFYQALDVARRQQAKSLELRAVMSLCRLWRSQGKGNEPRNLLSSIYAWFTEGLDTEDLKQAKALLAELD